MSRLAIIARLACALAQLGLAYASLRLWLAGGDLQGCAALAGASVLFGIMATGGAE